MPNDFKCPYCSHTAELNDSTYKKVKPSFEVPFGSTIPPKESKLHLVFLNALIALNIPLMLKELVLK